jgi:hypothetical protein
VQDRDADEHARRVDDEEHPQLVHERARTRLGVGPVAVPGEVADDGAGEGDRARQDQPIVNFCWGK